MASSFCFQRYLSQKPPWWDQGMQLCLVAGLLVWSPDPTLRASRCSPISSRMFFSHLTLQGWFLLFAAENTLG